ncbi:uncharacterized protein VP01_637g13 [Puccinia sorghi]|uniref:Uncharacterized protein n=1 Tax=Puccinia sorghi TaxID=27349 RepID=A0A0L6UI37_9BASI|nr:uncharacterized protein VP01_637g13 [Puccinia sorghi]
MITRSQGYVAEEPGDRDGVRLTTSRLNLAASNRDMDAITLYEFVRTRAEELFPQIAKELQIKCVISLVAQHVFSTTPQGGVPNFCTVEVQGNLGIPKKKKGLNSLNFLSIALLVTFFEPKLSSSTNIEFISYTSSNFPASNLS